MNSFIKILHWLFLYSFFYISFCYSQDSASTVVDISNISLHGMVLNKGWKFHAGDSILWSKKDFNDNNWSKINPTIDIHSLPEIPKPGIFWLRLHIHSGNSIRQLYSMLIQQSGASEIYLDDSLIYKFGIISKNEEKIQAYDPLWRPLPLPVNKNANHILAVRFQLQPHIFYTTIFGTANPLMWIGVTDADGAIESYRKITTLNEISDFIPVGIFLLMFILHMSLFIVYAKQKANLYFALYAFATIIGSIMQLILLIFNHRVEYKFYIGNLAMILFLMCDLFILIAITYLFGRRRDLIFKILVVLFLVVSLLTVGVYPWGWMLATIFTLLIYMNVIRMAIASIKKRKRGAWIIAMGGVCSILCYITFIGTLPKVGMSSLESPNLLNTAFFMMFILSLPTSVSIFLALDFAFTNKSLEEKLLEVNQLSEKNMIQEREKQQILSSQNEMLEKQVNERTTELKQSLTDLRSTQSQLIQSEKMASLGELTAGIAHEIQNPLNFVNNFSEVNAELFDEMEREIDSGNLTDVKAIARDIKENERKITLHGKRADAIVKSMMQHSRTSTGHREPVDINALADEYLRLCYHGLRVKDGFVNVNMQTNFDPTIGKVNLIALDIGRVLLNLYNNAFYSVSEKKKQYPESYEPTVSVFTKRTGAGVELKVKDNGNGIPRKVLDKIFQPFFTTKPAGQGTGLGLSLSYDIIKTHGGELKVESKEGDGAEFVVLIPAM